MGKPEKSSPIPSISLPKGGGAIRGIGEKFSANPVTGTGSMSVPIATSQGRSGFGPQLSLSYDSGAGNGPFGFGWSLSLPQITRKTEKGLPQYLDAEESDVFILSGAEDLVPVFKKKPNGEWELDPDGRNVIDENPRDGYLVRRYRPRIEGLFARIERWTRQNDGDVHWRSISKDNILTLYGKDSSSRITDPVDRLRVFTWLICETRDDKGNAVLYEYKPEDGDGVGLDLTRAHERNRGDRNDQRRATNRYLKRIRYGNRVPLLDNAGHRPRVLTDPQIQNAGWMFEVVFDYEDHDPAIPMPRDDEERNAAGILKWPWTYRQDPFSTYRSGFEVRTTRLCQRVLMFHHFAGEPDVGVDCLVRSTDFIYSHEQDPTSARNPVYTFMLSVTQSGYKRNNSGYQKSSLPPVEYQYTQPIVQDTVRDVDAASLENLPIGVDGMGYQWTDLHGEGIPGILTEQAGAWFYKRNISPISEHPVEFAALERVVAKPNLALAGGQAQFMDLAGDGQPDLAVMDGPLPGLYEHDGDEGWQPFRPFTSRLNRDTRDPNLKFVDLNGDGHADVLISEDDAFVWHASLAEEGFGQARRILQALDEEKGSRLVFADGTQSIYLADLSGDGLTDLVRIRNGELCYWPNLGYGRFGAKVTMDHAPHFDHPDQFDHKRIRLADIDGTGTTDLVYLHRDGVRLYFNESGNSWSEPQHLNVFPRVDDLVSIVPTDLLGNGTACLIWSSPLPGDARRQMRYVNLMGGQKPHLLVRTINNLGAETHVEYVSSTKFYLQDKRDGKPWITRLPFPVHVVERVETYDRISRNRFVTRYTYHHGYFDGEEREFRGFGMVEQLDTEELGVLMQGGAFPDATNLDKASHVLPVLTKTWFHTGIYLGRNRVSNFFAGLLDGRDVGEYYPQFRSGDAVADAAAKASLLDDTVLPTGWTLEEEPEACRALKGSMLRQEVYALDGTDKEKHPYTVTEQNFTIERLQPMAGNRHTVFFAHAREAINCQLERNPADPRISHAFTLEVDPYGNVIKSLAVGYGRRQEQSPLEGGDKKKQEQALITYTENEFTNPIADRAIYPDDHRTPLPCETRTYEITGLTPAANAVRFCFEDFADNNFQTLLALPKSEYEQPTEYTKKQKRLIERVLTLYRKDDLSGLLGKHAIEPRALPGESYKLAFTPGLLDQVYDHNGQKLLPADPADVLKSGGADRGGYVDLEGDGYWWIPAGRIFLSSDSNDTSAQEFNHARLHFFLPRRYRDPFHTNAVSTERFVTYDAYDLLLVETRDTLGNRITVGERDADDNLITHGNDYRVLQPVRVMDRNRNRTRVAFDTLGMVVGTAVMGKDTESKGDLLDDTFVPDLDGATILAHIANPLANPYDILQKASTRQIYDLFAYQRTKGTQQPTPAVVYTLVREIHHFDLEANEIGKIQHSFSYSDGFGRMIQKKIQAEPGALMEGGATVTPRWVGSGWTIFNNKGKPVRQYEPFFSATHGFEFAKIVGVSSVLYYDPVGRLVATLHPNHTYEKVVFDPWSQATYDVNDTITANAAESGDPRTDKDIKGYVAEYFKTQPDTWKTWHQERIAGGKGAHEKSAAEKAARHANTPTIAHFDALGRPFLALAHNGFKPDGTPDQYPTRFELDIEGNQRAVIDAKDRVVMCYDYDMLGNRMHQTSMEAGPRWMLKDITGKPIRTWDSRGHQFKTEYDQLRRPVRQYVSGTDVADSDPRTLNRVVLFEKIEYGEGQANDIALNLRSRVFKQYDGAGVVTNEAYDFKGNVLRNTREVAPEYKDIINWANASQPLGEPYSSTTSYDALNRPVTLTAPDASVIRTFYNEANLLERLEANLRGSATVTHFVTDIDYNAKGQRIQIDYGNGVRTFYDHDPLTFRLVHLLTRRNPVAFPDDCPQPSLANWPGCQVQNLHYTYDPVGNITHIRDDAQQIIYFRNKRVEPSNDYLYDAIYRLIEATGREHLGQIGGAPIPHSHTDAPRVGIDWAANDGNAMGTYTERYVYDAVGNFLKMQHRGSDPVHPGWTRTYAYGETSMIEDGTGGAPLRTSNRLSSTRVGNNNPPVERYVHDAHGNIIRVPHLGGAHPDANMHWDYRDRLRQSNLGGGGTAYYVYDAAGQRVRKVWEKSATLVEERIYVGCFEIYRRRQGAERLERETLHLMDDKQRIALVETRTLDTAGNDLAPPQLIRYQLGNHLASSSLELDDEAQIISYEEYTAYGSASYQAVHSQTEIPKRYRYTGKERDEESGLYYHGFRYYAAWLARWASADPIGIGASVNLYLYAANHPTFFTDPDGREPRAAMIDNLPGQVQGTLPGIVDASSSGSQSSSSAPAAGGRGFLGAIASGLRSIGSAITSGLSSIGSVIESGLRTVGEGIKSVGAFLGRVASGLRSISGWARDWLPGLIAAPVAGLVDILAGFTRALGGILSWKRNEFTEGLKDMALGALSIVGLKEVVSEKWAPGGPTGLPTDLKLPPTLAGDLRDARSKVPADANKNGMHAWHAASNAAIANRLGPFAAPFLWLAGLVHESPIDWKSFKAEQHYQGTVNHVLDSTMDIVSNTFGILLGLLLPRKLAVRAAASLGNYIPGPGDPDPAFGGAGAYTGDPSDAWGQYP